MKDTMTREELLARSQEIDKETADVLYAISVLTGQMSKKLYRRSQTDGVYGDSQPDD